LALTDANITVERLVGGGINRIIDMSIETSDSSAPAQYILRIPRFEAAQVRKDLAPLHVIETAGDDTNPRCGDL